MSTFEKSSEMSVPAPHKAADLLHRIEVSISEFKAAGHENLTKFVTALDGIDESLNKAHSDIDLIHADMEAIESDTPPNKKE